MKKFATAATLALTLCCLLNACSKGDGNDNEEPPGNNPGGCQGTAGPPFTAVRQVIEANCTSCHSGSGATGGLNLSVDCNIVTARTKIKQRAVDGNPSFMPPPPKPQLSNADKAKITDWINAGGRFTD